MAQAAFAPSPLRTRARRRGISLTPLIDVVFILLVFYMLASTFTDWRALPLELGRPTDQASAAAAQAATGREEAGALLLDVAADRLRLSGRPLADDELLPALAALDGGAGPAGRRFILRPAPGVPLQRLVAVMDILAAAGVADLSLSGAGFPQVPASPAGAASPGAAGR